MEGMTEWCCDRDGMQDCGKMRRGPQEALVSRCQAYKEALEETVVQAQDARSLYTRWYHLLEGQRYAQASTLFKFIYSY